MSGGTGGNKVQTVALSMDIMCGGSRPMSGGTGGNKVQTVAL